MSAADQVSDGLEAPVTPVSLTKLDTALAYARLGYPVFPVHSIRDGCCTCGRDCGKDVGKHPRTRHGFKDATVDPATITGWWEKWPDANIGIATGAASGSVALDIDPRNGGDESLAALEEEHGELPATVEATTGGGGRHLIFRHPGGRVASGKIGAGIDVKGDGGYIVAPPSNHISGCTYRWRNDPFDGKKPAPLPDWLHRRLVGDPAKFTESEELSHSVSASGSLSDSVSVSVNQAGVPAQMSTGPTGPSCRPASAVPIGDDEMAVIDATLPDGPGQRNDRLHDLVRGLVKFQHLREAPLSALKPIVRTWFDRAKARGARCETFDATWQSFLARWKCALNSPLIRAMGAAETMETPAWAKQAYDDPLTWATIRLCMALEQQTKPGEEWYVSFRALGSFLRLSHTAAGDILGMLLADEVLVVVERHKEYKATRYRFRGQPAQTA